jgi:WD40 repeat protein
VTVCVFLRSGAPLVVALGACQGACSTTPSPEPPASVEPAPQKPEVTDASPSPKAPTPPAEPEPAPSPPRIRLEGISYVEQVAFVGSQTLLVGQRKRETYDHITERWEVDGDTPDAWGEGPFTGTWALSSDRKTVVFNVEDEDYHRGRVARVDVASGRVVETIPLPRDVDAQPIAISADGTTLATSTAQAGDPAVVTVWSLPSGKRKRRLELVRDTGYDSGYWVDVALTSDGSKLVALAINDVRVGDEALDLWDIRSGRRKRLKLGAMVLSEEFRPRSSDSGLGYTVAISPDDRFAAAGIFDFAVRLWSMETGAEVLRLLHDDDVTAVAFSPDGKRLASAAAGRDVRLWELDGGRLIASQPLEGHHARSLAFSADGGVIAVGETESVLLWKVGPASG